MQMLTLIPSPVRLALKAVLRYPLFAPLIALFIWSRLKVLSRASSGTPQPLTLLVLSAERWRQDLQPMGRAGTVNLLELGSDVVGAVNSLFSEAKTAAAEEGPSQAWNERQIASLVRIVDLLKRWTDADAIVTCSFWYKREQPWSVACDRAGLPFVAWHKEFTVLEPRLIDQRVAEMRANGHRFRGTHLCCVSDTAREVFARAGVFPAPRIAKVGLLRADNLFNEPVVLSGPSEKPSVVLFSFGHLTGPFPAVPSRNYYFSKDGNYGFVELFRDVHAVFADAARRHPEVDFLIKPKYVLPGWIGEIDAAIRKHLGVALADIPNCRIVANAAPELMRKSRANVVFNSTTAIESRLLDRNTIIPVLGEASGEHASMVYFRDFFDLFAVADTANSLAGLIDQAARGEDLRCGTRERLHAFLDQQIGNPDGRSGERFLDVIRSVVTGVASASDVGAASTRVAPMAAVADVHCDGQRRAS